MKVEIRLNKTLGVYDVIPLEGEMQGSHAATVEAIVLDNVQSDDGCISGDVVAVWGMTTNPVIDNATVIGLASGKPWPEQGTGNLREFYAVDEVEVTH